MSKRLMDMIAAARDESSVKAFADLVTVPQILKPSQIEFDRNYNKRLKIREDKYTEYAEMWRDGIDLASLSPMIVFYIEEEERYVAIDCWHRLNGWIEAFGDKERQFQVAFGSARDASVAAFGANPAHGIPRTNEDKRAVVDEALQLLTTEDISESNETIARICGVSSVFVGDRRRKLEAIKALPTPQQVRTANGGVMKVSEIGTKAKKQEAPTKNQDPNFVAPLKDEPNSAHSEAVQTSIANEGAKLTSNISPMRSATSSPNGNAMPDPVAATRSTGGLVDDQAMLNREMVKLKPNATPTLDTAIQKIADGHYQVGDVTIMTVLGGLVSIANEESEVVVDAKLLQQVLNLLKTS